ncbi:DNA-binding response regulator [Desulfuromonas versatilis]|uniref:DNA-binding response regulator n=1 Tax=Desulfuromonas versatilis TaxID=2802975 RepID=A0ABM8HZW4_9BACT|nr:response regulator transcription factor [Desulfuromonas versatilis]BCR06107.1 DNA-binding response regulator [Desulfuromonas versatilis]
MSGLHILLVEDEPHIARGLIFNLEEEGYRVSHAASGEQALEMVWDKPFALVILDVALPGIDGIEVCRRIREEDPRQPVLMLTARSEERDRVEGLSAGADDYLTKPFSLDEFLLRVKGMLRRSEWYRPEAHGEGMFTFGENAVDLQHRRAVTLQGEIDLTELEVKMLRAFFRSEGKMLSRAELLEAVWGMAPDTETRTLDNFLVRMRKYFEADPANPVHFLTVRGRGYRFVRSPGAQ